MDEHLGDRVTVLDHGDIQVRCHTEGLKRLALVARARVRAHIAVRDRCAPKDLLDVGSVIAELMQPRYVGEVLLAPAALDGNAARFRIDDTVAYPIRAQRFAE